jgi:excisionase family DNA binding protein
VPDKDVLVSLAQDLPTVWNAPATDMRLKQRIIRILVHEVVADVDEQANEIVLLLHWAGGRHSELRMKKNAPGRHGRCTSMEAIEVIRQMAGKFSDQQITATLNRLGLRTGAGHSWTETRVKSARHHHRLPVCDVTSIDTETVTMQEAAEHLGISERSVRRLIEQRHLLAVQVVACAPWQIPRAALEMETVRKAVQGIKNRVRVPQARTLEQQQSMFSGM